MTRPKDWVDIQRQDCGYSLFKLAQQHTLTTDDATYLELARREGVLLATQDKAL
jgi:hypothetical protein